MRIGWHSLPTETLLDRKFVRVAFTTANVVETSTTLPLGVYKIALMKLSNNSSIFDETYVLPVIIDTSTTDYYDNTIIRSKRFAIYCDAELENSVVIYNPGNETVPAENFILNTVPLTLNESGDLLINPILTTPEEYAYVSVGDKRLKLALADGKYYLVVSEAVISS